ncbi:hypothetical protein [Collimonas pratensis]|uniref:hypothetical protein n=1 Tax=Collimonas pratensis TaxID=279113 RepID=UPI000781772A|nr:hypothetical protein [Collimonas pratensis]
MNIDLTKLVTAQQRALEAKEAANAGILAKIVELETTLQPRATREFFLNGDKTRLQEIEDQVTALRAQLV